MMNTLLSILVCIAMLCSGTGALPAQPETAVTWTLRNLTIGYGGERVTLAPEARVTTAIGTEKAQLHFEVGSGEDVLMPVSGELTPEGVRFTLGRGEQAYAVTDATLTELMDLDADDVKVANLATDFIADYCALLSRTYADPEFAQSFSDVSLQAMIDACGAQGEETEVKIDGESYPAQLYNLDLDLNSAFAMLDKLRACGIAEVEALVEDLVGLCTLAMGEEAEFTSFADLAKEMGEMEVSYPMVLTLMQQDDLAYGSMAYSASIEGEEFMEMNVEAVSRGEESQIAMAVAAEMDGARVAYDLAMEMTGPYNAPEAMNMDMTMSAVNDDSYTYEEGAGDETEATVEHLCESQDAVTMVMTMNMENVGGLEKANVSMNISNSYVSYTDGEEDYSYETTALLEGDSEERAEADGSVTTATSLRLSADGETFDLSFDLNRAEGAPVDALEGLETHELTAEMDEESPVYGLITADMMDFASDAMRLAADDSVIALTEMLGMGAVETDDPDAYAEETHD